MNWPRRTSAFIGSVVFSLALCLSVHTHASHYRLSSTPALLSKAEVKELKGEGILTTKALLDAIAGSKNRRSLAKRSKLSYKRLSALAFQCDLLRVTGLGPSAVLMLQGAGIKHSAILKRAEAERLHKKLLSLNQRAGKGDVVPSVSELSRWIQDAKGMRALVDGAR